MYSDPVKEVDKRVHRQGYGKVRYGDDDGLYVVFSYRAVKDGSKTDEKGRPFFKQVEWVEIHHTGGKDVTSRPVRESDIERWPRQYEAFRNSAEQIEDGLPLESWPILNKAQVEDLKSRRVYTVEQLASIHDGGLTQLGIPGIRELQKKAKNFLEATQESAPVQALIKQKEDLELQLSEQKEFFQAQLNELKEALMTKPVVAARPSKKKRSKNKPKTTKTAVVELTPEEMEELTTVTEEVVQ